VEPIKAEIVPATEEHAHYIASNIRPEDKTEIWAASMYKPKEAMLKGMKMSDHTVTGLANGEPVAMWGMVRDSLVLSGATPWLVATTALEEKNIAIAFIRRSRGAMLSNLNYYGTLENYVDARNTRSIQWLKWIGFTIEEPEPYGPFGLPFHRFHMNKEKAHV